MRSRIVLAIFILGFSGIVAQVLLLRELLITFHGNELSIGIILANWLILEALGAFCLGKRIENRKHKIEIFVVAQLVFCLFLPIAVYLSRTLKNIAGVIPGEIIGLVPMFFLSLFVLVIVSLAHGSLFTFGCSIYNSANKNPQVAVSIGKVYIYETIGTLVGSVVFTYFLIPHYHSVKIAMTVAALNLAICPFLLGRFWHSNAKLSKKILGYVSVVLFALCTLILLTGKADYIQRLSIERQWHGQNILQYENSIYGNVVATKREEQYTFFANGNPVITTPTPDITFVEESVHLPMLYQPAPRKILIISGGAGGVISEVLKHPVEKIDYVEIDPLILKMVKKYATPLTNVELSSSKVNIHHSDGRYFVKNTLTEYDLIMIGLSVPQDLQVNRLFTEEFFLLTKARLTKEGIFVMNLPGSLTYLSEELRNLNQCILNTLGNTFPNVKVIPGDVVNLYLASQSDRIFTISLGELRERLNERNIEAALFSPDYISYKLHPRWHNWFLKSLKNSTNKINTDFHPIGVFYSLAYWHAYSSPYLRGLFRHLEKIDLWMFIITVMVLTILFLFLRTKIKSLHTAAIPLCIATTGFAGMLFELLIIFAFQTMYGYVFYWIGIVISALMVGITAGSQFAIFIISHVKKYLVFFAGIEILIIAFSVSIPVIFLKTDLAEGGPAFFLFVSFISGMLIGLEFPLASKIYLAAQDRQKISGTAGLLYGADLFGGWLGGILGGVVLLPVLGLLRSCLVVLVFKVSSVIILLTSRQKNKSVHFAG